MSFLDERHPEYRKTHKQWTFAWDQYTGEYVTKDRDDISDPTEGKLTLSNKYLQRKVQAETEVAYAERILTSDPQMLFATAVDSLNGILFSKSDSTLRDFGELGDYKEAGTTAYKLFNNADGEGMNWIPLMKNFAIRQTVMHKVWALVDGIGADPESEAKVKLINPTSVVNWWPSDGMPEQVLVKESKDIRTSIMASDGANEETYVLYELDGWTRFRRIDEGEEVIAQGDYNFYASDQQQKRILPIFPVELPMPRFIGYHLAMKQNFIYNFKSIRDFAVRNTSFSWLSLVATKDQYEDIIAEIKKGFRVLRQDPEASGNHQYLAPPSDHLDAAADILDKDKEEFNESAFKSYGDAAKQATATEIRQESRSGVEAFLSLLVTSMDEFEKHALFLLEQIYFPQQPSRWGIAMVKRSDDFQPKDIEEALTNRSTVVRNAKQANAMSTKTMVETLHPEWEEDKVEEEVRRINEEMGAIEVPSNQVGG